ncbi:glycosyltransferase family 2 protein [Flavobacterium restrictum]|uniref:Glycosyltransferase n=1 Tax=Flavobacterium restrictum TaxID=2594428 RepID=A0A553E363_9FLAO|nr:glycosyltransferase [Flavobacterium restrictum]TRX39496.1 glycosyltransferase [Flavobacterium restrictum]
MITIVLFLILFIYVMAIALLIYGYSKINSFESIGLKPKTKFSILVPFRNEAQNLPFLLESFSKLNYPTELFEVLLIDDFSSDRFVVQNLPFTVTVIKNSRISNSPKKDAITTAVKFVKNDWIITTDADCIVNENWLLTLDNYIQNHDVSMLAGAVTYACNNSFLYHFQQLDLASLQGATIGSFGLGKGFMCNGANFAYTKTFFLALNGFEGNDSIASGDDVFLLQKAIAKNPKAVHYLKSKNTIVTTKPLNDWKSLFYQRVRWASKTGSYQSRFGKGLAVVVFAGNLNLVFGFGFLVLSWVSFQNIVLLFLLKFIVDTVLIYKANIFLTTNRILFLVWSSLWYPFFSVSVALYSFFGKYEWKGRRFSK